ncbi:DUF7576 family protein [Natronorubrum sp. FCH18a]|uniref:DUF7576 family protein n=1 Tax=Natronorubrum sp. FCH18a TaxID=3447018 RepID=UPI003F5150AA
MDDNGPPSTAETSDSPDRCATCGTSLDPGSWHPTVGYTDSDGTYRIVRFCSDACHHEWRTSREETGDP